MFEVFNIIDHTRILNFIICIWVGGQILERRNVERPIFRNFKIANVKVTKDELFDSFIFTFNFSYFRNPLYTQNT